MLLRRKLLLHRTLVIFLGLGITAFFVTLLLTPYPAIKKIVARLDYINYDLRLAWSLPDKTTLKNINLIKIIDIDDQSLQEIGRWPWSRTTIAELVTKLKDQGVVVTAFDIIFSEPEKNIANEVLGMAQQQQILLNNPTKIQTVKTAFASDNNLATVLKQGDYVLGMIFDSRERGSVGTLPVPIVRLTPEQSQYSSIHSLPSYSAPIDILMQAANSAGFVTTIPDFDGTLRRTPLVLRIGDGVYGSLALEAVAKYFLIKNIQPVTYQEQQTQILEGIQFGDYLIPTDEFGQALVPYIGPAKSFETFSAADVLAGRLAPGSLDATIVFIGSSALGLGDLKPIPLANVFPGVEIHANVAAGIFNQSFKHRPHWATGIDWLMIVFFGTLLAIALPFISPFMALIITTLMLVVITYIDWLLWARYSLDVPISLAVLNIGAIGFFNLTYGFMTERKNKQLLKSMFSQYVPPAHIDALLEQDKEPTFEGDSREMTVLFMDIRNFTYISETLSPTQLKHMLNEFFTAITDVIFKNNGTIDKYVGDMVMAFWGAPLASTHHARDALSAALGMQAVTAQLKPHFAKLEYPEVNVGIGVNTGMMNVGDMGSIYRRNYTVLGDSVNLASRLEGISKHYKAQIITSEFSKTKQADYMFRRLDNIRVKGKNKPVIIFGPLCLLTEASDALKQELQTHEQALTAYLHQDWAQSEKLFQQLHSEYPAIYVYEVYLDRIQQLRANPPGADWDGIFTFTTK